MRKSKDNTVGRDFQDALIRGVSDLAVSVSTVMQPRKSEILRDDFHMAGVHSGKG